MPRSLATLCRFGYLAAHTRQRALDFNAGFSQVPGECSGVRTVDTVAVESDGAWISCIRNQDSAGSNAVRFCVDYARPEPNEAERLFGIEAASVLASGLSRQASRIMTPIAGSGGNAAMKSSIWIVRVLR